MATETGVNEVSAAGSGSAGGSRSLKALVVGSSVVLWVLALFAITSLNSLRAEMKGLRNTVDHVLAVTQGQSLEAMQAVDQDGEVAYTFKRAPLPANSPCGMPGGGACGMGSCGSGPGAGMSGCGSDSAGPYALPVPSAAPAGNK